MLREWPLVVFTLAGQTAVGILLFAAFPVLLPAGPGLTAGGTDPVILAVVLGLLVAAALVSFFHLHHPFRARRVLANFRTSWLSREIFFELVFMALVALAILLVSSRTPGIGFLRSVYLAAALAGIFFLLSMIRLYMLETLPFWDRASTPLAFLLTTLALGSLAAAIVQTGSSGQAGRPGVLILLSLIFAAADFCGAVFIAPEHGLFGHRSGPSLRPPGGSRRLLHWARLALSFAGAAVLGVAVAAGRTGTGAGRSGNAWLVAALALMLAGQVIGRFLFYGLLAASDRR